MKTTTTTTTTRWRFLKTAALGLAIAAGGMIADAAQAQTLRMWTFLNPAGTAPREKALAEIIKRFEAANPGVKIAVEPQVWDQMTPKFLAAHRAGIRTVLLPARNRKDLEDIPESVRIVRELGFDAAVSTTKGAADGKTDLFQIPRFTPWDRTPTRFRLQLLRNQLRRTRGPEANPSPT